MEITIPTETDEILLTVDDAYVDDYGEVTDVWGAEVAHFPADVDLTEEGMTPAEVVLDRWQAEVDEQIREKKAERARRASRTYHGYSHRTTPTRTL